MPNFGEMQLSSRQLLLRIFTDVYKRQIEKRLEALGMTRGTSIAVLNSKSRGVLIVKVRGTRFALGDVYKRQVQVKQFNGLFHGESPLSFWYLVGLIWMNN